MAYDVATPDAARVWPYTPDWSRGYGIKRAYSTDITRSRNRTEQRRSLRDNPRMSAEYTTVVSDSEKRLADHHMRAWQNRPVTVPDWARWARLTAQSNSGTSALTVNPMPAWVAADQLLVLCSSAGLEQVLVLNVIGTTVNLVDPLAATWASGSVIRPTFFGLFDGSTRSSRLNKAAAAIDITISAYPGGEPPRAEGSAWATFNGFEVFTPQPDYISPPTLTYLWDVERVDYERGRTAEFRPVERFNRDVEAEFTGLDVDGAEELEQFFDRMKGRRGAFYMPTWEKDFALAAGESSGSTSFLADGPELAADFASAEFDDSWGIAVCLTDGTHIYRLVTGIAAESGDSRVTVNSSWGVAISTANVARISWMPLRRFASDEMTTLWRTPLSAGARLGFTTVPVRGYEDISFVGGKVAGVPASTGTNTVISLADVELGGEVVTLENGDLVIVAYSANNNNSFFNIQMISAGWIERCDIDFSNTFESKMAVYTKVMGAVPDSSFTVGPTGSGADAGEVAVSVHRGVNPNTPLDVAVVTGGNLGTKPNPTALTPLTPGAYLVIAAHSCVQSNAWTVMGDLGNLVIGTHSGGTIGIGSKLWPGGAYDCAAFTGGVGSLPTAASTYCVMALRPAGSTEA